VWKDFLQQATVANSDEAAVLHGIIMDSIAYMTEHYAASGEKAVVYARNQAVAVRAP
jgi:hypothetical protein